MAIWVLEALATGWKLTRHSFGVIREHPVLMVFPLIAGIAITVFGAALFGGLVVLGPFLDDFIGHGIEYAVLFVLYFGATFIGTYCTTALVFAVNDAFHGRSPAVRAGMTAAWERKRPILVWSLIAAAIGVILEWLKERDSSVANIATTLFDISWTLVTFFIVPVIVFEDASVREMFTKSAKTFRETWGETLATGFGIGVLQLTVGIFGFGLVVFVSEVANLVVPAMGTVVLLGGLLVVVLGVYLLGQTVRGIAKTALYMYATEGTIPEAFTAFDFETLEGRSERAGTPGAASASSSSSSSSSQWGMEEGT